MLRTLNSLREFLSWVFWALRWPVSPLFLFSLFSIFSRLLIHCPTLFLSHYFTFIDYGLWTANPCWISPTATAHVLDAVGYSANIICPATCVPTPTLSSARSLNRAGAASPTSSFCADHSFISESLHPGTTRITHWFQYTHCPLFNFGSWAISWLLQLRD